MELYRLGGIAAITPNLHILHVDQRSDSELARLEPVAALLGVDHVARSYDGGSVDGSLLLPVPMSLLCNSYRLLPDLVDAMCEERWFEIRPSDDTEAACARLDDAFPCGLTCRWSVEHDQADVGVTLILRHGEDCPESDQDDEPRELEAAA